MPKKIIKKHANAPVDVAVIGMGLMGRSIAACLLSAGHRVIGVTDSMAASKQTPQKVRTMLVEMRRENLLKLDPTALMKKFSLTDKIAELANCGIVFESVTEDTELKRSIYREVERFVAPSTIIATNTSAIPVTILQAGLQHPERVLGVHWDEPCHVTRFLEIIPGKQTAQKYLQKVSRLAPAWGKEPSMLRSEIRGFISNRISYAMYREACHLVDSGICTVEDVDRSLRNDVGWWSPFAGPFRYMDLMGVPAYHRVMKDLLPDLNTSPEVPALMKRVVEKQGGQGIRNGRGFYRYTRAEAELWERRFTEFNYRIRKLLAEFSEESFKVPKKKSAKK